MSIVTIRNVEFLNNPAKFGDEYKFRVTFDCIAQLEDDLEWKLIYVSSPDNEHLDQELDDCLVGPVPTGINSFEFSGSAPDPKLIPEEDVLGVAALILTGSYRDQEFVRVGYYQNTEYAVAEGEKGKSDEELEKERERDAKKPIEWDRLMRDISTKPRVTRFQIKWDVTPPGQGSAVATGAATSAPVPSADDIEDPAEGDASNAFEVDKDAFGDQDKAAANSRKPESSSVSSGKPPLSTAS
ncbi:ASF1 like histone chaperone-domain-containing protein [Pterulicium gracile]|uniref:Anti-silencing function protein 1 n=1 Tax=Pterulicium gracile TaxID=1884261 RepID=A0A5C3QHF0_9AGAR|nr:ASF1 like histone chaperone-domain-containing protein [Pterula gracilis]